MRHVDEDETRRLASNYTDTALPSAGREIASWRQLLYYRTPYSAWRRGTDSSGHVSAVAPCLILLPRLFSLLLPLIRRRRAALAVVPYHTVAVLFCFRAKTTDLLRTVLFLLPGPASFLV